MSIYNIEVQTISGETKSLSEYKGKVLLIVNTASACGLTPHYKGLQSLYEHYQDKGLVVLGFPCNQFGGQEPGTNEEIQSFCELNYKVTFPLFDKIDVKGENAHPLYTYLLSHTPETYRTGEIEWNFVKFLVDASGIVVKQYSASTDPATIAPDIETILA
jgi:glutathione peroxidase